MFLEKQDSKGFEKEQQVVKMSKRGAGGTGLVTAPESNALRGTIQMWTDVQQRELRSKE